MNSKRKEKDWFKDRGYPHFTNKTPKSSKKDIERKTSNPNYISRHSFSPLLLKQIKQRRYKEANFNGILRRSHKKIKNGKVVSNTKIREILYATHIDAHIYSYYTQKIIAPKYELHLSKHKELSEAVTAYRRIETEDLLKFKNNVHFAKDVFDEVKRRKNCVVLAFDIENFFPSLNHKRLKLIWSKIINTKSLPKDHYNIFKAVTKFSYVKLNDLKTLRGHFDEKQLAKLKKKGKHTFFESIKDLIDSDIIIYKNQKKKNGKIAGIPQGLPISALLANMYMLPFDEAIINKLVKGENIFYRRYSDDIIAICNKDQIDKVNDFIINEIQKIDLIISKEKTEKTLFKTHKNRLHSFEIKNNSLITNKPLNYLGFEFYGYQTLLKSKNLASFYRDMKDTIKRKHNRVEKIKEKYLLDEAPIFKRKIYRLYSFRGEKKRKLSSKKLTYIDGKQNIESYSRIYRGNYIKYAYKASEEMKAPEIKRQLRNHWKILQLELKKYDFSNVKKGK